MSAVGLRGGNEDRPPSSPADVVAVIGLAAEPISDKRHVHGAPPAPRLVEVNEVDPPELPKHELAMGDRDALGSTEHHRSEVRVDVEAPPRLLASLADGACDVLR